MKNIVLLLIAASSIILFLTTLNISNMNNNSDNIRKLCDKRENEIKSLEKYSIYTVPLVHYNKVYIDGHEYYFITEITSEPKEDENKNLWPMEKWKINQIIHSENCPCKMRQHEIKRELGDKND